MPPAVFYKESIMVREKRIDEGFSLIETIISIGIITIGVLSLAGTLGYSVLNSSRIRQVTIAKYIAVAVTESIISARESQIIPFQNIAPVSGTNPNGFATGIQPVSKAGTDRVFGTADDTGDLIYTIGPNSTTGLFKDGSDQVLNLTQTGYRRQITITDLLDPARGTPIGLKQINVQIFYPSRVGGQQSYTMTTVLGDYRVGNPS